MIHRLRLRVPADAAARGQRAQEEIREGMAGVAAVEGKAAAGGRRVLEIEGVGPLPVEPDLHRVTVVRPGEPFEDLVAALDVARAGSVAERAEARDGDRGKSAQSFERRDQTRNELAGIEVRVLWRAEVAF